MAMLEVNHQAIQFGGLIVQLMDLTYSIEKGRTTARSDRTVPAKQQFSSLLTGVYKPTEGIIKLDGQDITGKNTPI